MTDIPDIPEVTDPDFSEAVSALARAAHMMHKTTVLILCAEADPERVLQDHADVLETSEAVIEKWSEHLGIDD